MNWINGVYAMGIALACISGIGILLTIGYLIDNRSAYDEEINWKRTYPSIAVLTAALLAGAFMAGAAA